MKTGLRCRLHPGKHARAWIAGAVMFCSQHALAGEARGRVAVLTPREATSTMRESVTRLCAELASSGFDVERVDAPNDVDPRAALERWHGEPPVVAAFILVPAGDRNAAIDVWLTDRLTDKTSLRRVEPDPTTGLLPPATLAIRAVELLRASLVELRRDDSAGVQPATQPLPTGVSRIVDPIETGTRAHPLIRRGVSVGGGLLVSANGLGAAATPVFRLTFEVAHRLALRLAAALPGLSQTREGTLGAATVRQDLAIASLVGALRAPERRVLPYVFVGAGTYHLQVSGTSSSAEFVGSTADVWSFAASAGIGLGVRLGRRVAMMAEIESIVVVPAREVTVAGAVIGRAGRPLVLASMGVAWTF